MIQLPKISARSQIETKQKYFTLKSCRYGPDQFPLAGSQLLYFRVGGSDRAVEIRTEFLSVSVFNLTYFFIQSRFHMQHFR